MCVVLMSGDRASAQRDVANPYIPNVTMKRTPAFPPEMKQTSTLLLTIITYTNGYYYRVR